MVISIKMSRIFLSSLLLTALLITGFPTQAGTSGPVRVLFLGHNAEHHPSNDYYPILAQALGPDAIYFDYVTSVEEALGDAAYLARFDALLLYANHAEITPKQWEHLFDYVENGGGFLPVHCASWCFANEPGFEKLVGGRFAHHQGGVFRPRTIRPDHPAIRNVPDLEAWDETYVHRHHVRSRHQDGGAEIASQVS